MKMLAMIWLIDEYRHVHKQTQNTEKHQPKPQHNFQHRML